MNGTSPPASGTGSVRARLGPRVRAHLLGAGFAVACGLLLVVVGPLIFPAGRNGGRQAPFLYMITVFPFFGFALAEAWLERGTAAGRILLAELGLLTLLAFARLFAAIPASGHVMMQVWFLCGMRQVSPPGLRVVELILAGVALLSYGGIKLFLWGDLVSPGLGALFGVLVYLAARRLPWRTAEAPTETVPSRFG